MCLQSGVYLNISANPVQPVVYNCRDRRSPSTSRCCLDIYFATRRVGAGARAGLQLPLTVGSFGLADLHHCYWRYANRYRKTPHFQYEAAGQESPQLSRFFFRPGMLMPRCVSGGPKKYEKKLLVLWKGN